MKKLLVLLMIVLLSACSATAKADTSLQKVIDSGKLIFGYTEYPPLGFTVDGSPTGFDVEIATEVAKRLNVTLVPQYIDWDSKVLELNNRNVDVIWNGLTITADREKEMTFSKPYLNNRIVVLTLTGTSISKLSDLTGKKVGVELQSSGQLAVEENKTVSASINELVKYTTITEAILDLNAGGIDAIVADEIFARYATKTNPTLYKIADEVFNSENYGIGFRKGDVTLQTKVDSILDDMAKDGTAAAISIKWFGENVFIR